MTERYGISRRARLLAVPLALVWVLSGFGPADASPSATAAAPCLSVTGAQVANPSTPNVFANIGGVATLSACNAWLVGHTIDENPSLVANDTLIEHWDGASWTQVPSPSPGGEAGLSSVSAVSATNIWAVGSSAPGFGPGFTLVEHWDGTSWSQVPSPSPGSIDNELESVSADSATDAWAVGETDTGSSEQPLIEHWDGSTWSVVSAPGPSTGSNPLSAVSATSPTNAWAVGTSTASDGRSSAPFIEHWDGTAWSLVSSPGVGSNGGLSGVAATSGTDAWAVGEAGAGPAGGTAQVLIEHWDGSSWSMVSSPATGGSGGLASVAATSATDAWAVGAEAGAGNGGLIEHWDGSAWSVIPVPDLSSSNSNDLFSVAAAPNHTGWTIGHSAGAGIYAFHLQCC